MVSWEETTDGPLLYRHWLTDHGYTFEGNLTAEQIEAKTASVGGLDRYIQGARDRLTASLYEAANRWWNVVEDFVTAVMDYETSTLDALLTGIPEGLASRSQLDCMRARILYNQQSIRDFVNGQGSRANG